MKAFCGTFLCVVLCALVLPLGGCGDAPKTDVKAAPPTDFRKFSATAVAARIKSHQKDFTDVSIKADGTDKFAGTATTADGKKHDLKVTVTENAIDYKAEKEGGFISGTIKESSTAVEVKTP